MYNALRDLLIRLIAEMIAWVTDTTSWLVETSLSVENARWISDNPLTLELISDIYMYIYGAVVTLVALKFLWKGFQVYILWRDGDSDVSPHHMLLGVCLALIVSLAFPTVYNVGVSATADIGNGIVQTIDTHWPGKAEVIQMLDSDSYLIKAQQMWDDVLYRFDVNGNGTITPCEIQETCDYLRSAEHLEESKSWLAKYDYWMAYTNMEIGNVYDYIFNPASLLQLLLPEEGITVKGLAQGMQTRDIANLSDALGTINLWGVLLLAVYFIAYIALFARLIGRSFEMLLLRWGLPIAAVGLINSDGGIFPSYIQLIFKQFATSVLQVIAMYLSFYIAMDFSVSHVIMGLAIIGVAFRGPALLAQILTPQKQGAGVGPKLHTALMLRQLIGRR